MNHTNQTIINAIVQKAKQVCPGSLALIAIYGSMATGDEYEKSDLDLLILIHDDNGWKLGSGFILDDTHVGYDIYCTNWDMLNWDAACNHARLSKLFDAKVVYVQEESVRERLEQIKAEARAILESDKRMEKAKDAFTKAKLAFGECCLSNSISKVRRNSAYTISCILDALMLYHGTYFKLGVKRTLMELESLPISPVFLENLNTAISSENADEMIATLKSMLLYVEDYITPERKKVAPSAENISGTYEEMYSNWRNKMEEAAKNGDVFSSFMNLFSFENMIHEIANDVEIEDLELMGNFHVKDLSENLKIFDEALEKYKENYTRAGIQPKHYANVEEFVKQYC